MLALSVARGEQRSRQPAVRELGSRRSSSTRSTLASADRRPGPSGTACASAGRQAPGALHHPPAADRRAGRTALLDRQGHERRARAHLRVELSETPGAERARADARGARRTTAPHNVTPGRCAGLPSPRWDPAMSTVASRLSEQDSMPAQQRDRDAQAPTKSRFIFVTGGVVSSLGKGIAAASIGRLLVARGLTVGLQKFDPYINVDPGTMSPYQHGEVFVTEDGAETDLDLGHYERFTDVNTSRISNVTAGGVYNAVIRRERRGDYLGSTVQVVPHITDEIKQRIALIAESSDVDVVITEIGGTVGDIESLPFLEAIRQFPVDVGRRRCMFIHLTLVPYVDHAGELKTKPTQHSVNELRRIGIAPDMLMCRSEERLSLDIRRKIALFASLPVRGNRLRPRRPEHLQRAAELPRAGRRSLHPRALRRSSARARPHQLAGVDGARGARASAPCESRSSASTFASRTHTCRCAKRCGTPRGRRGHGRDRVGRLRDARAEADADARGRPARRLAEVDGILIPGGFGGRGIEGKIAAARIAREQGIPFLGICLGMQIAVAEFARHVAGMEGANSTEFDHETPYPGDRPAAGAEGNRGPRRHDAPGGGPDQAPRRTRSRAKSTARRSSTSATGTATRSTTCCASGSPTRLAAAGLRISGTSPDERLVETIEIDEHPFFVASQFHPEFKSRPERPAPLFTALRRRGARALRASRRGAAPAGRPAVSAACRYRAGGELRARRRGLGLRRSRRTGRHARDGPGHQRHAPRPARRRRPSSTSR